MREPGGTDVSVRDGLLFIGFEIYNLRAMSRISREMRIIGYRGRRTEKVLENIRWFLPLILLVGTPDELPYMLIKPLLAFVATFFTIIGLVKIAPIFVKSREIYTLTLGCDGGVVDVVASPNPQAIDPLVHLITDAMSRPPEFRIDSFIQNVTKIGRVENINNQGGQIGNRVFYEVPGTSWSR